MAVEYRTRTVSELVDDLKAGRIRLPVYQRRRAWDDDKRQALIDSMRQDWPIGSLLLNAPEGSQAPQWSLIDGQQRLTTLTRYCDAPCAFMSWRRLQLKESTLTRIASLSGGRTADEVRGLFDEWIRERKTIDRVRTAPLQRTLHEQLGIPVTNELTELVEEVTEHIATAWDIQGKPVSVIYFKGTADDAAKVFNVLNTQGSILDKFDLLAVGWKDVEVDCKRDEIRSAIVKSYEEQERAGIVFEEPFDERSCKLVEYLFGLGKALVRRFPALFGGPARAPWETEEVGFNAAATAHGLSIRQDDIRLLGERMEKNPDGKVSPEAFELALFDTAADVQRILRPLCELVLNRTSGIPEVLHNTSHMLAITIRFMFAKYTRKFTKRVDAAAGEEQALLRKTLPQHYVKEVLEGAWSGAAAETLFTTVWARTEDPGEAEYRPSRRYLDPIDRKTWITILDNYHNAGKAERSRGRSITKASKVFLRFLLFKDMKVEDNLPGRFEIEHLIPVSRLRELMKGDAEHPDGWPVNSVANLALIDTGLNREKSKKTLHEHLAELSEVERRAFLARNSPYLECDPKDTAVGPHYGFGEYVKFLDRRWKRLRESMLSSLGVS
jgi:hypothetical protein